MIRVKYLEARGRDRTYLTDVYFLDTTDLERAREIAEMRAPKNAVVRVERYDPFAIEEPEFA